MGSVNNNVFHAQSFTRLVRIVYAMAYLNYDSGFLNRGVPVKKEQISVLLMVEVFML